MSTLKVNAIESQAANSAPTIAGLQYPTAGPLTNRNLIINGAMQVAQRGTSTTAAGYLLDRFQYSASGATGTYSQESFTIGQTDVPGADKYLKLDITTGDNNSGIYHKIEAKNAFNAIGGKVTLSYYAKGTSPTDGLQVGILWFDGSTSSSSADTTVTLTGSWVKYTHTFDVPSISGLTLTDASAYLEVHWQQASTDTGTAAYELQLTQVQLEVGEKATPFEHRSFGDELDKCKRYYQQVEYRGDGMISLGYSWTPALAMADMQFEKEMRATPTITLPSAGSTTGTIVFLTGQASHPSSIGSHAAYQANKYGYSVKATGYSGLTDDSATWLYPNDSTSFVTFKYNAEL
jgi:hypothetical protein